MKKIFLSSAALCFSTFFMINAMGDSWWDAEESKRNHTNGFQGCVNKEKCGNYGHYRTPYSPEGFCKKCELGRYPERFEACLFCRMPWHKVRDSMCSFCCDKCSLRVQAVLAEALVTNKALMEEYRWRVGAFSYFEKAKKEVGRKVIKSFGDVMTYRAVFKADEKRCFYLGGKQLENGNFLHAWSQRELTIDPNDKKVVLWGDEAAHVEYICEKYNIFGPETGTATLDTVPANSLMYEEVVDQPKS